MKARLGDLRIYALLDQPRTRKELAYETGLPYHQVRKSLARLAPWVAHWPDPEHDLSGRPALIYQRKVGE